MDKKVHRNVRTFSTITSLIIRLGDPLGEVIWEKRWKHVGADDKRGSLKQQRRLDVLKEERGSKGRQIEASVPPGKAGTSLVAINSVDSD